LPERHRVYKERPSKKVKKGFRLEVLRVRFNALVCGSAALLITSCFLTLNLSTWVGRLSYPGDESYEGIALAEMIHLRQGVPIYVPRAIERYDAATYGPLYYLFAGRLVNLHAPSFFPLRVLSVLGILGCAAGCGLLAFWLTNSYLAAFLSPMVFLSYGMVSSYGTEALSDGMALLLMFSGFLVAYRFQNSRGLLLAIPLMILGFYYKPQYVAGPTAVFFFLLCERKSRLAAEFGGLLAFCGLAMFGLFQWIVFYGQAFWRHFLLSQTALLSWHRFEKALFVVGLMLFLPLIFEVEYLRTYPNRLITHYLFFGIVFGTLTYSKDGSGVHYFFESILLVSILVPVLMVKQMNSQAYPIHFSLVLGIMLCAGQWSSTRPPKQSDVAPHNALQLFLREKFPPHAEALSVNPSELLQAGLETPFPGLFQLVQLAHRGVISDRYLVDQIQAGRFSVIVLSFDLREERDPYWLNFYLTTAILEAIKHSYVIVAGLDLPLPEKARQQDRFYVYVPRHE
jgi:hypothetical protein